MSDAPYVTFAEQFVVPLVVGGELTLDLPFGGGFWSGIDATVAASLAPHLEPMLGRLYRSCRSFWARFPTDLDLVALLQDASLVHDLLVNLHPDQQGMDVPKQVAERLEECPDPPPPEREVLRHVLVERALDTERHDHIVRWSYIGSKRAYGRTVEWRPFFWRQMVEEEHPITRGETAMDDAFLRAIAAFSPLTAVLRAWGEHIDFALASRLLRHRPLARLVVDAVERDTFLRTRLESTVLGLDEPAHERWMGVLAYIDPESITSLRLLSDEPQAHQ